MYLTKVYVVSSRVNGICSVNLMGRISAQDANSRSEQACVHLFNVNSHAFCLHSILIHCAKKLTLLSTTTTTKTSKYLRNPACGQVSGRVLSSHFCVVNSSGLFQL